MYDSTTLVIGDGHVEPDTDLSRWTAAGNYIVDRQPDTIVQIGDFVTYDSISSHNSSKRLTLENKRCRAELEAAHRAYDLLMSPIREHNERQRANRKAKYQPKLVWIEGNHEDRAMRYAEEHPEMFGLIDYKHTFNPADEGWEIVPYRGHYIDDEHNVAYTHVPMNAINNPIGGKHSAKNIIKEYRTHIVYGHTHKLIHECDGIFGSGRLTSTSVGCFFEETPEYARGSAGLRDWWSGLVQLNHSGAAFDIQTINIRALKERYL